MLDTLLDIELAYSILKSESDDESNSGRDPLDVHFDKLNTLMEVCNETWLLASF